MDEAKSNKELYTRVRSFPFFTTVLDVHTPSGRVNVLLSRPLFRDSVLGVRFEGSVCSLYFGDRFKG
jgi:hypothetical protein